MSWIKLTSLIVVLLAGMFTLFVLTPQSWPIFKWLFPTGDIEFIQLDTLQPPDTNNHFLLCPEDYCVFGADQVAPVYDMPVVKLRGIFFEAVALNPYMSIERNYDDVDQYDIVERSKYFAVPDIMTVRFFKRGEDKSTFAIYSRSVYGSYDFGVNRARVEKLLRIIRP